MAQQNMFIRYIVRHTYLVRSLVMAGAVAVMLVSLTIPFFTSARDMSSKITAKKKESNDLAERVTLLSSLDQNVLDERVRILDTALPPRKDVVLYLSAIDGLSRELNLSFGGISLAPGEVTESTGSAKAAAQPSKDGLHTLETDLEITGTKENIYTFLRLIEESSPLMQIKDVKVSGLSEESFVLSLRLGMLYAVTDTKDVKGPIALFDEKEEKYFQDLSQFRKYEILSDVFAEDTQLGKSDLFESFTPQQ